MKSWCNTKFSCLPHKEMKGSWKENYSWDRGSQRVKTLQFTNSRYKEVSSDSYLLAKYIVALCFQQNPFLYTWKCKEEGNLKLLGCSCCTLQKASSSQSGYHEKCRQREGITEKIFPDLCLPTLSFVFLTARLLKATYYNLSFPCNLQPIPKSNLVFSTNVKLATVKSLMVKFQALALCLTKG